MSIKRQEIEQKKQGMCKQCMLFFGAEAYQGLCSTCFKKNQSQKKIEIVPKIVEQDSSSLPSSRKDTSDTLEQIIQQPAQTDKKRCFDCKKKVGLLGIECKCGFVYCNSHRLPEEHSCVFNFKQDGKKKLQKQIVKVYNGKIGQI